MSAPVKPRRGAAAVLAVLFLLVLAFPATMGSAVRAVFGGFALVILAGVLLYVLADGDSSGRSR